MYELIRGHKLLNILRNGVYEYIENLYEVIRRKRVQVEHVERPIDNFVQVIISPPVAAIVHSNY